LNKKVNRSNESEIGSKMMNQINLNLNQKEDRSNGTGFEGKVGSIKWI
jgi:hypothetical protein